MDKSAHTDNDEKKLHERDHSNETTLDKISGSASAKVDMGLDLDVSEEEMKAYSDVIKSIAQRYLEKGEKISGEIKGTAEKINSLNQKIEKKVDENIGSNSKEEFKFRANAILDKKTIPLDKEALVTGIDEIRKVMRLYENNKELEGLKGYYADLQGELYEYAKALTGNSKQNS